MQHGVAGEIDIPSSLSSRRNACSMVSPRSTPPPGRYQPVTVAVPDQEHPGVGIQHHGANAERHAADQQEIGVENSPQQRLESPSDAVQTFSHWAPSMPRLHPWPSPTLPLQRANSEAIAPQRVGPLHPRPSLRHPSDPDAPAAVGRARGKRAFGYVNWMRNRHKYHRREILDALCPRSEGARARPHRGDRRSRQSGLAAEFRRRAPGWTTSVRPTA